MNLHKLSAKVLITEHSQANKLEVQDEFESFTKNKKTNTCSKNSHTCKIKILKHFRERSA